MNSPQAAAVAQVESAKQQQQKQPNKPRRSMRSDTLGSTGSSRASSCDEPIIAPGTRSPPSSSSSGFSSANSLCHGHEIAAAAPSATTTTTGAVGTNSDEMVNLDEGGRKVISATLLSPGHNGNGGGQLKANPSSCSLDSINWTLTATDLVTEALGKPQLALSSRIERPEAQDDQEEEEEDDNDDDDEDDDDEEEEEEGDDTDEPTLLPSLERAEVSQAEAAARKPPIAPPFESITLKLKSNTMPPDARFVKRHIEDLISQNEAIVYNWNSVSIRSYNSSSSSATSASPTTAAAAAALAPTRSPLIPAPMRKTSASAYIGDLRRPASGGGGGGSESISGGQSMVSQQLRQRKRWSTTVLGDFQKHPQQQPIALVATQSSYSTNPCDKDKDDNEQQQQQQASTKTSTPPLAQAQAPINYRLRQLEQRRSQSHLVPMRKTSEYSLLSVAATENTRVASHRLSHGSSLLQDRRQQQQQQQQVDTFHRRFSQDPLQLENGIQNLSLKRKDNNNLLDRQDEQQKFETTSSANLLLLHHQQQQQQLQHQYNLLNNATNQAHITTSSSSTSSETPIGHHHFNLDQISQHLGLNQHQHQQQRQQDHHHHCNEQMLLKFLMEKNLLEHQMNLGNQAAAMLYLQQHQHHHDNQNQHQQQQQHMIEHQQQMEEFRLRQLAAAAAAVSQAQGSSLEPSMPLASHIVNGQSNDIMDHYQMAMLRGSSSGGANNASSVVPSLLSSLGDTHSLQYHHHIQQQQQQLIMQPLNATGCQQQQQQPPPPIQQLTTIGCSPQVAMAAGGSQELRNQAAQTSSGCLPFKKRKISEPIMRYG